MTLLLYISAFEATVGKSIFIFCDYSVPLHDHKNTTVIFKLTQYKSSLNWLLVFINPQIYMKMTPKSAATSVLAHE